MEEIPEASQTLLEAALSKPKHRRNLEHTVRLYIAHGGSIPSALRFQVWKHLLAVPLDLNEAEEQAAIDNVPLDLPNQRVIRVDAERTRINEAEFSEAGMLGRIQRLLTYYCKAGYCCQGTAAKGLVLDGVGYKQGLNEVLAVFLHASKAGGESTDGAVMAAFAKFLARFAPRIYASHDDEFMSLQCSFRLFRLLMQYHDPELNSVLDQYDVAPELYATPWFLTFFSRSSDFDLCMQLWDFLIACSRSPGPIIFHCVALAFLISHRDIILAATGKDSDEVAELPITVSKLPLRSAEHVREVCGLALNLLVETPWTFRRLIHNVCYTGGDAIRQALTSPKRHNPIPISNALLARLEKRVATKISIDELLVGAASRFTPSNTRSLQNTRTRAASAPSIATDATGSGSGSGSGGTDTTHGPPSSDKQRALAEAASSTPPTALELLLEPDESLNAPLRYFLIDCRSEGEYELGGHLPTAFHLDSALLDDPEALEKVLAGFAHLKSMHIAIMGAGDISQWYFAPVIPHEIQGGQASSSPSDARARVSGGVGKASEGRGVDSGEGIEGVSDSEGEENKEEATLDFGLAPLSSGSSSHARTPSHASADHEDESIAVRAGLDPLTADEEHDYAKSDVTRNVVLWFLQKGFSHVSEVEGGYTALHQHQAHYLESTLIGHDPEFCMVCSAGEAANRYPTIVSASEAMRSTPTSVAASHAASTSTGAKRASSSKVGSGGSLTSPAASVTSVSRGSSVSSAFSDHRSFAEFSGTGELSVPAVNAPTAVRKRLEALGRWLSGSATTGPEEESIGDGDAHVPPPAARATYDEGDSDEVEIVLFNPEGTSKQTAASTASAAKGTPSSAAAAAVQATAVKKRSSTSSLIGSLGADARTRKNSVSTQQGKARRARRLPPRLVVDRDDLGLPIFAEATYLDMQCDELERHTRRSKAVGDSHAEVSAHHTRMHSTSRPATALGATADVHPPSRSRKASADAPTAAHGTRAPKPKPVNVDEIIAAKASSAARSAALAARHLFSSVMSSPSVARVAVNGEHGDTSASAPVQAAHAQPPPAVHRALPPSGRESTVTASVSRFLSNVGGAGRTPASTLSSTDTAASGTSASTDTAAPATSGAGTGAGGRSHRSKFTSVNGTNASATGVTATSSAGSKEGASV